MDEGCLFFLLHAVGSFLFEILGAVVQGAWDFGGKLTRWLYREAPVAVRMGARLGALGGCLWGLGLGLRYCPAWLSPPVAALGVAFMIAPLLGLIGGLAGWGCSARDSGRIRAGE